ncbi:MAG: hypothetical protein ACU83N_05720 [Gammaproteobacteria bacterium]
MKQSTRNQSLITFLSLFVVFTALSLATQIQPSFAKTGSSRLVCQDSQRGIRCGSLSADKNLSFTSTEIEKLIARDKEYCAASSRGTRCIIKRDEIVRVIIDEYQPSLKPKSSCSGSARGTRCG